MQSVLDEVTAHRLLEFSNSACSVPELRNVIQGIYKNKKRRVSLAEAEWLIYAFDDDWTKLVNSPDTVVVLQSIFRRWAAEKHLKTSRKPSIVVNGGR